MVLFLFVNHERKKELGNVKGYAQYALHSSINPATKQINFEHLKNLGFVQITNEKLIDTILKQHEALKQQRPNPDPMIMMMHRMQRIKLTSVIFKSKIYLILRYQNRENFVFATPYKKEFLSSIVYPSVFMLLVILLYIAIIKNILPLYSLRHKIQQFANGNYDIDCKSNNKDEIGILSNDFDRAVKKIKRLRDSRQLFLRNIMHELKTPIAKGKFATELAEDVTLKKMLSNIFVRQETLLEEFSRIEKLTANELKIKPQPYLLEDVLDFALDILNHDSNKVGKNLTPMKINVDFELFGTALKNLLDNGINYANNAKVSITNDKKHITIINTGKALEFPLEKYQEPFYLGGSKQQSSRGLGFGLYITLHVIELHNMTLTYRRDGTKNIFTIKFLQ